MAAASSKRLEWYHKQDNKKNIPLLELQCKVMLFWYCAGRRTRSVHCLKNGVERLAEGTHSIFCETSWPGRGCRSKLLKWLSFPNNSQLMFFFLSSRKVFTVKATRSNTTVVKSNSLHGCIQLNKVTTTRKTFWKVFLSPQVEMERQSFLKFLKMQSLKVCMKTSRCKLTLSCVPNVSSFLCYFIYNRTRSH